AGDARAAGAGVPDAACGCGAVADRAVSDHVSAGPASGAAWRAKPCWAVFGTADRPVAPDLHRFQYELAGSTVTEVEGASHFLMLSQPDIVAGVIREAVMASPVIRVAWSPTTPRMFKTILMTGASRRLGRGTAE